MKGRLEGKVALVTGGGMGIGRACAIAFAREDAAVIVTDIQSSEGEATAKMIKKAGGEALFIKADVSASNDNNWNKSFS